MEENSRGLLRQRPPHPAQGRGRFGDQPGRRTAGLSGAPPLFLFPSVLQIEEPEPLEEASRWRCHTLTMNGYLNESNFTMVEEGFTSRDLLESTLLELCQAVRAGSSAALCVRLPLEQGVAEQPLLLTSASS